MEATAIFGEAISSYSREQAIEDGFLVDVSEVARELGIKYHTVVTSAVWEGIIEPDRFAKSHGESSRGRLMDVLVMFRFAARQGGTELLYKLIATKGGRQHTRILKAVCGPGDTEEPVITIMLPSED